MHQGRCNFYQTHFDVPLRQPAESHHEVSALLRSVVGDYETDLK